MTKKKPGAVIGRPRGARKIRDPLLGVRIPVPLRKRLDALAEAQDVALSALVRALLEQGVERLEKRKR